MSKSEPEHAIWACFCCGHEHSPGCVFEDAFMVADAALALHLSTQACFRAVGKRSRVTLVDPNAISDVPEIGFI